MTLNNKPGNGTDARRDHVRQAVKNACGQLNSDGVEPRNYVEQLSWLFFLKAFEASEDRREEEAEFEGTPYERCLDGRYRWSVWTRALTGKKGALDGLKTSEEVFRFVNADLFEKLITLGDDTLGLQFQRIFTTVRNHSRRPGSFARVVEHAERIDFSRQADVIELSEIYERLLKDVAGDSAGYAGEFYTQRHIVRAMVEVVKPRLGDVVYDPCMGTAGFLFESADYMKRQHPNMSGDDFERFQKDTFIGNELKPLSYLLGVMNMILHGIDKAKLALADTLERHESNVAEKQRFTVIISNPPYGGKMDRDSQGNFTIQSAATEILFLQHIMAKLGKGGRAGVILPEGVLFRGGPDAKVRKKLLTHFKVHTILSLPAGAFLPYAGVKTNVLFFDRPKDGSTTDKIWFYELTNDGFELKQTRKPIEGSQLPDFLAKWGQQVEGDNSWVVDFDAAAFEEKGWDLTARNPCKKDDYEHIPALELVRSIRTKEERIFELLGELEGMLEGEA